MESKSFMGSMHEPLLVDREEVLEPIFAKGYPNTPSGMPGVETSLPLMLTQAMQGRCSVAQVSNWMSTAVAKAYRIPKKRSLPVMMPIWYS